MREVVVADPTWPVRHWETIRNSYRHAPHYAEYSDAFEELYRNGRSKYLSEINYAFIARTCEVLGITTAIRWSYAYEFHGDATQKLVDVCLHAGAAEYVSGPAARAYLDEERFAEYGIRVRYFDYSGYPEYEQLYPPFLHEVTVLDLLFHTGSSAPQYMKMFAPQPASRDTPAL